MPRRIDEVKIYSLPPLCRILHLYGVALDSDTTLTFQIHVVEHLVLCYLDSIGVFQESVSKGRLTMIYV